MREERENPRTVGSVSKVDSSFGKDTELEEGVDYYLEEGMLIFTAAFLRKRSYCCESGCRHCPYARSED